MRSFDRGFDDFRPVAVSNGDFIGVALTTEVVRSGEIKSHIIFDSRYIVALMDNSHPDIPIATYIIAHECAHVEVNAWQRRAFPNDPVDESFGPAELQSRWSVISACWNEYAACRISAVFGPQETARRVSDFRQSLERVSDFVKGEARQAILTRDYMRLQNIMYVGYGNLMKMTSYMLGQLDGLGDAGAAEMQDVLESLEASWFQSFLRELSVALRTIWALRGQWSSKSEFLAVGYIALSVIEDRGVQITPLLECAYVRVTKPWLFQ